MLEMTVATRINAVQALKGDGNSRRIAVDFVATRINAVQALKAIAWLTIYNPYGVATRINAVQALKAPVMQDVISVNLRCNEN